MENELTYNQFAALLKNAKENEVLIITRLKNYSGTDERLLGAKLFMEQNADIQKLCRFLDFVPGVLNQKKSNNSFYKIAASITLLIGLSLTYFYFFYKSPAEKMLSYYMKDVGIPVLMSTTGQNRFDKAMNLYKQNDYEKAGQLLQKLNTATPNNDTVAFYLGEVSVLNNNYSNAVNYYSAVNEQSVYYSKARLKLALMLYHSGNKQDAKQLLISLRNNSDNEIALLAQKILKEFSF